METINHECYVSLEIAKLLKEAGFDWKVRYMYRNNNPILCICTQASYRNTPKPNKCPMFWQYAAPTLEIAQRWLREEKNINIEVKILSTTSGQLMWYAKIYYLQKHNGIYDQVEFIQHTEISYDSYEQALEAGIQKCLTILLENK